MMKERIKVIIAEDHVKYRKGLIELLDHYDIETIDVASDGKELLSKLTKVQPDIVLLDLRMKEMDGDIAFDIIKEKYPDLKVIIQSFFSEESTVKEFMRRGVHGFLPKDADDDIIAKAINDVYNSKRAFYFYDSKKRQFTLREAEVISLVCEGKTNKEIAKEMGIARKTVEGYRKKIFEKTQSRNASQLVTFAVRKGLDLVKRYKNK